MILLNREKTVLWSLGMRLHEAPMTCLTRKQAELEEKCMTLKPIDAIVSTAGLNADTLIGGGGEGKGGTEYPKT
jgi:hypothetical protein